MSSQMFAHGFAHGGMPPAGFFPYGLIGWVAGLLLIAGLVLFAVWAVRTMTGPRMAVAQPAAPAPTALDVLQRRFAAGEMTAEEYRRARDTLGGSAPPPAA